MLPDDKVTMSVVIDREAKEVIEKAAKELDISASMFARNMLYMGLDDYKLFKKVGIIRAAVGFRALLGSLNKYKNGESKE